WSGCWSTTATCSGATACVAKRLLLKLQDALHRLEKRLPRDIHYVRMPAITREKAPARKPLTPNPRREVPVVEFRDVTKLYEGGAVGIDRVSMRIGRGEFVFLVGPTGCGKSTCIRLRMKEIEGQKGKVWSPGTGRRPRPPKQV